jgi:hypothetical protein
MVHGCNDTTCGPGGHAIMPPQPLTLLKSTAMMQHSVKKELKIFGNDGVNAVLKELQQLYDRKVMEPKGLKDITGNKEAMCYNIWCSSIKNATEK